MTGGRVVGSRGSPAADIAIVGEAPGTQELITGEPFRGPSGELLESTLRRSGLPPSADCFVTNALRCRPPVGQPPPSSALATCRGRLEQELLQSPKRLILALGNSAIRSLTRDYNAKITQIRG